MDKDTLHTFHIPVLGLGYSIDTPVKVARFGISSVVSIIEDELVEKMRKNDCKRKKPAKNTNENTGAIRKSTWQTSDDETRNLAL